MEHEVGPDGRLKAPVPDFVWEAAVDLAGEEHAEDEIEAALRRLSFREEAISWPQALHDDAHKWAIVRAEIDGSLDRWVEMCRAMGERPAVGTWTRLHWRLATAFLRSLRRRRPS